jgi:hypothetical protein
MKRTKDSKGFVILGFTLVSAVIAFVFISSTTSRVAKLSAVYAKSKSLLDAQIAIDDFAVDLKRAYDLATPPPDSTSGTIKTSLHVPSFTWSNRSGESIGFFVADGSKKICVSRSDARDSNFFVPGSKVSKICINLPGDFFVRVEKNQLYVHYTGSKNLTYSRSPDRARLLFEAFRPSLASAGVDIIYDPDIPSGKGVLSLSNISRETDETFRKRYADYECTKLTSVQFCVNINICVKYDGKCDASEYIKQSYVFAKVPEKSFSR